MTGFLKKIGLKVAVFFLQLILKLRYRITFKGLENLQEKNFSKNSGILFLPNHTSILVDPLTISLALWEKYQPRPLIVDYMYYLPLVQSLMKRIGALPVPNFHHKINSLKRRKNDQVFDQVVRSLKNGDHFLIYPAGKIKLTPFEQVSGTSGIHRILQELPDVNIVLIRIQGLWGSMFSRARSPISPPMFKTLGQALKVLLKNGLFFAPRRQVTISFELAPADFPRNASRIETNHWLEEWYNRWQPAAKDLSGRSVEPYAYVPYTHFSSTIEPAMEKKVIEEESGDLAQISAEVKEAVIAKIAAIKETDPESISTEMNLSKDLGFDSLEIAELLLFLEERFNNSNVSSHQLTTVKNVILLARKDEKPVSISEGIAHDKWLSVQTRADLGLPEGDSIIELFLKRAKIQPRALAVADEISGMLTYQGMLVRVLLIASYIERVGGETVGILLPASVGATILILACQLAGKTPVMINWTVGRQHLETVLKTCQPEVILTSWSFTDKLDNVDLDPIADQLVMMEDLKPSFTLKQRLKALFLSKLSAEAILKRFKRPAAQDSAVVLFTSGTEGMPKGVPLTHQNILSNLKAVEPWLPLEKNAVLLSFLPPFHSFGFSLTTLFPLLIGIRTVYYPNPNDSKQLVFQAQKWQADIICGAPTFLRNLLRASEGHLKHVRYLVSGAEKASQELKDLWHREQPSGIFIEGYGITECSPVISLTRPGRHDTGVGRPLSNIELLIVHPETHAPLDPLQQGQHGLILVRGPNVFHGYLNAKREPFVTVDDKKWYDTGDMGYVDGNGSLHIVARLKRFIKVGGEMISLVAIEEALARFIFNQGLFLPNEGPLIAVIAQEEEDTRPKIIAVSPFDLNLDALNQALRNEGFSSLVRLSEVKKEEEIPLMGTGKIHYRSLESRYFV